MFKVRDGGAIKKRTSGAWRPRTYARCDVDGPRTDTDVHEAGGLVSLVRTLRRRALTIGLATAVVVAAALVLTALQAREPRFEASSVLVFKANSGGVPGATAPQQDPVRAAQTNRELVLLGRV